MELDWSTFLLEIANFLILVWILKRFLYRPILNAIEARKKKIEDTLNEASKIREEALALQAQNEGRRDEWERARQEIESKLAEEISSKRSRMLLELNSEIEKEKERKSAQEARQIREWQHDAQDRALANASRFASILLSRVASFELESKLYDAFMEDLEKLDAAEVRAMLAPMDDAKLNLSVSSAYPLSPERRSRLEAAIGRITGRPLSALFSENPDLLCGMRVGIGPWVLHANLRDELAFFRGASRNAG